MDRPRIVLTHWVHDEVLHLLRAHGEVVPNVSRDSLAPAELDARAREADALMVFMLDRIDAGFLDRCARLRVIAGALKGCDNVDIGECTRRGVWVSVVPDLLTAPTAELAVGLALALLRRIVEGDAVVRSGDFRGWRPILYGGTLDGSRVGILGMGRLGRAITRRLHGFGAVVRYTDPQPVDRSVNLEASRVAFDDLLATSEILFVSAPLTPDSLHRIDASALGRMPAGACLVNVGRGSVVDEEAVARALATRRLGGYAADVFEMEDLSLAGRPSRIASSLLAMTDRTVFTPHLGSAVDSARREIALAAARNIADALTGRRPRDTVNEIPRALSDRVIGTP
jgi:phosphonate dehydrogenase